MTTAAPIDLPDLARVTADARARADEIEEGRCLPQDLAGAMADAGVFRMLVPACHGGLEVHPREFVDVLRTLARADGATGWIGMIGATTGSLAATVREDWSERIWGADPAVITCGVTAPLGRARRVDGGYRVTGRWPFGSASRNARWICGGASVVDDAGEAVVDARGRPELLLMVFDAADVHCHDNWRVSGLCGTGSGDIEVEDAFVPEGRCAPVSGRPHVDTPLFRFPLFGLLACLHPVANLVVKVDSRHVVLVALVLFVGYRAEVSALAGPGEEAGRLG